jgi:hypothetical protein
MRLATLFCGLYLFVMPMASAQQPPSLDLSVPGMPPSPLQQYAPQQQTPPQQPQTQVIRPVQNTSDILTTGVLVKHPTVVRSKPSDQGYPCNATLMPGTKVTLLDLPKPGSQYAAIEAPANCYSLIPTNAIYLFKQPKDFLTAPQRVNSATETFVDGEPGVGMEYVKSGFKLMKNSLVDIVGEIKIKVNGKMAHYVRIRTSGKEARYVRIADLEGVEEAVRQAQLLAQQNEAQRQEQLRAQQNQQNQQAQQQFQFNGNARPSDNMWADPRQGGSSAELEQLSPALASQVQQANQAYQNGLRSGAWEDALMRYQQLLGSEVMSLRILAKNRLEFIREWQANPPTYTAQQQTGYRSPTYNHYPWVPGNGDAFRTSVASNAPVPPFGNTTGNTTFGNVPVAPAPVRDVVVKPTAPAGNSPNITFPTYQDPQQPQAFQQPSVANNTATPPANNTTGQPPANSQQRLPAQGVNQPGRWVGKLHKAVQHQSFYYLTNSQGTLVHYVQGNNVTGPQLTAQVGRNIEVEGRLEQVFRDGQQRQQIIAIAVRPLR